MYSAGDGSYLYQNVNEYMNKLLSKSIKCTII